VKPNCEDCKWSREVEGNLFCKLVKISGREDQDNLSLCFLERTGNFIECLWERKCGIKGRFFKLKKKVNKCSEE